MDRMIIPTTREALQFLYENEQELVRRVGRRVGKTMVIGFLKRNGSCVRFTRYPSLVLYREGYKRIFEMERQNDALVTFAVHY